MAIIRNYKAGAVIYFEGDSNSKEIFVLKSGEITLQYRSIETNTYVSENLRNGEFFGVKSSVGNYPREETAQVKSDASTLVFTRAEFEELAVKNVGLVVKILKIFSNQLRRVGKQAATLVSVTGESSGEESISLFKIGEFYLQNKRFKQAEYVFRKYLALYPDGNYFEQAKERMIMAQKGFVSQQDDFAGFTSKVTDQEQEDNNQTGFEEDDSFEMPDDSPFEEPVDFHSLYDEVVELIQEKAFNKALQKLNIVSKDDIDPENYYEKLSFNKGICYYGLEKYQESIDAFTQFIKENPKTSFMKKALLNIGKSYKELEDFKRADNFFKKVISLPPADDEVNEEAKASLSE